MDRLEISIKVELKNVIEFQLYHTRKSKGYTLFKYFSIVFIIFCLYGFSSNPKVQWEYGLLGLLYAFFLFIGIPILIRLKSKNNYLTQKGYETEIYYTFNNNEIQVKGSSFDSKFSWDNIFEAVELKTIFILYGNKYVGIIIPKRHLDEFIISKLRDLLRHKINIKSKPIKKRK